MTGVAAPSATVAKNQLHHKNGHHLLFPRYFALAAASMWSASTLVSTGSDMLLGLWMLARVKPHGYYQACRVSGKATTCEAVETEQEGTRVLEVPFDPQKNMILNLDCVGILKLRNADVEQKRGMEGPCHRNETCSIIGKNFTKAPGSYSRSTLKTKASGGSPRPMVESEYFSQTHLICPDSAVRQSDFEATR
uniref:Uncharacterized protein n=1 Tax=Macrostomum lignano TaxID=282301 RepID=A0A1I8IZ70_9PLAT